MDIQGRDVECISNTETALKERPRLKGKALEVFLEMVTFLRNIACNQKKKRARDQRAGCGNI